MKPIGVIHSPFTDKAQTPIQPTRSQAVGQVEVFPDFDTRNGTHTGWYETRNKCYQ